MRHTHALIPAVLLLLGVNGAQGDVKKDLKAVQPPGGVPLPGAIVEFDAVTTPKGLRAVRMRVDG